MKNHISLLFSCIPFILFAQSQPDLTTGPVFKNKQNQITSYFGNTEGDHYFIGSETDKKNFTIYHFNNGMEPQEEKEFETDYRSFVQGRGADARIGFIATNLKNDELYFIRSDYKDQDGSKFIRESVSLPELNLTDNMIDVSTLMNSEESIVFGDVEIGELMMGHSPDKTKKVFCMSANNFSTKNVEFQVIVTNEIFEPQFNSILTTNESGRTFQRQALAIGNDGSTYLLAAMTPEGKYLSEYLIYKYSPSGELVNTVSFLPDGRLFSAPFLKPLSDGSLILCGFTSTKSSNSIDSFGMVQFSDQMEAEKVKFHNLPSDLEEISKEVRKGILEDFGGAQCVLSEDGKITLAVEAKSFTSQGTQRLQDLYCFMLDAQGNLVNKAVLIKDQIGDSYSAAASFKLFSHDNEVFILYNDHDKNADISPTDKPKSSTTNAYLTMYFVKLQDSRFERTVLYDSSKEKLRTFLRNIYQTESGDLIFNEIGKDQCRLRLLEL